MPRLILLPGLDGTGELFSPFVTALDDFPNRIVPYPSDRPRVYADLENHVRAQLPVDEDYVLLAESFSGPIGISIAANALPRLRGLILCVTFAANPLPILAPLKQLIAALSGLRIPAALAAPWLYAGRATPELRRAHQTAMAAVPAHVINTRVAAILGVDVSAKLQSVRVPTMYMRANADRLVSAAVAKRMRELCPHIEMTQFDAPHFLLQTEPAACAAAVLDFIRRRCQPQ